MEDIFRWVHTCSLIDAINLVNEAYEEFKQERWRKKCGSLIINNDLVIIPEGDIELITIGDIHGDIRSLRHIFKLENIPLRLRKHENLYLIFLGDYIDRGPFSVETLLSIIKLKLEFKDKVILLRGNHEPPYNLIPYPHDFPYQVRRRFGDEGKDFYLKCMRLFQIMNIAVLWPKNALFVHGGIPVHLSDLNEISLASNRHPQETFLEEILWNDPVEHIPYWAPSPRGAGKIFGMEVSKRVLSLLNVNILVRGHEPCEGYKLNHEGLVVTLFSRKGPPYFNTRAAYLKVRGDALERSNIEKYVRLF